MQAVTEEPDRIAALAGKIRNGVLERSRQKLTLPTQKECDNMLQIMDIMIAKGADPAAYLTGMIMVLMRTATLVLSPTEMDTLLTDILGLERTTA